MPRPQKKKSRPSRQPRQQSSGAAKRRAGLPSPKNVREVVDFVSPQKVHYKILRTNESDAYDPPLPPQEKPKG